MYLKQGRNHICIHNKKKLGRNGVCFIYNIVHYYSRFIITCAVDVGHAVEYATWRKI